MFSEFYETESRNLRERATKMFERAKSLRDAALVEGRALTADENSEIDRLVSDSQNLYDQADKVAEREQFELSHAEAIRSSRP